MSFRIRGIEESSLYQDALQKGEARGRAEEARKILIRYGTKMFGPPNEQAEAQITALDDLDRLHALIDCVLDVASWDELLVDLPGESD